MTAPLGRPAAGPGAGRKNLMQLIQLRWIAVVGQIATIAFVEWALDIRLPLAPMAAVLAALAALNLVSILRLKAWPQEVSNQELFLALTFDAAALTALLYLSGGATNPFAFLYLLQVTLAAVLLAAWSTWAMVVVTVACFGGLALTYRPLALAPGADLFELHVIGMLVCFALDAALLVIFVGRVSANLREGDARLAALRQQAAEEAHIVRMGLLASGAAHELGTPLSTLAVILGDWRRIPAIASDAELIADVDAMQAEVARCKAIVTGILLAAGEARGEAPAVTTMRAFLAEIVDDRRTARSVDALIYDDRFGDDVAIVSDSALKQVIGNVIDNAVEASPRWVGVLAERRGETLAITVRDAGPGFAPEMIENLGRPYNSTKGRPGGGLGLFLVVNALRKLGGAVEARNRPEGGAEVLLTLPLAALMLEEPTTDGG
ncbi:ATP-binding protein [Methylopila sp. 73B]|uniref:ATP-binding protein n=1 Tax=Methylopila sp. 73B TaxID=1120792 RepID=UPI00037168A6|nr:ATP-binding protein [Methylopila sp. 73B]